MTPKTATLLRTQAKERIAELDEQAKEKFAAYQTELDKVAGEKDLLAPENRAEFERINALKKEHSEIAEQIMDLREKALDIKEWESGHRPDSYADINESHGQLAEQARHNHALTQMAKRIDLAQRIIESDGYKELVQSRALDTKDARVQANFGKLISKDEIKQVLRTNDAATGGAFVVAADSGILVELPQRQLRIIDLLNVGETDEYSLEFVRELTIPDGAAFVAEADSSDAADVTGLKPESTMTWEKDTETTKIVAHWAAITKKSLRNQAYMRNIVETRLLQGLWRKTEAEALSGAGGESFTGIRNTTGISEFDYDVDAEAGDTYADAVHRQMTMIEIAMEDMNGPLSIVGNKLDWQRHALAKNANGDYLNGKPGDARAQKQMWGHPFVSSSLIAEGDNLVGDYMTALLLIADDANVVASDGVNNFFLKNLVALLAEMEAMLLVPQPLAFCEGTNLDNAA